mmetsp:Transcript_2869/g.10939  ORF Transcript_2869/g.10939 Transcript_2869/m.10939 type:complete len:211 (-) Transcript_2869:132-764(-)
MLCLLELRLVVLCNICEFLLDVSYNLSLGGGGEIVSSLRKNLHEVVGYVASSQVHSENGVWKSISLINWNSVGNTITRVQYDTSGTSRSVQGEYSLDSYVHCWNVESLKHDGSHLLSVLFWVHWSLSKENRMLLWGHSELIVEGVMPDLLHIVPVGNHTVLNWIFKLKDSSFRLGFVTYEAVLCVHAHHDTWVLWSSNNGRENCSWSIVS